MKADTTTTPPYFFSPANETQHLDEESTKKKMESSERAWKRNEKEARTKSLSLSNEWNGG